MSADFSNSPEEAREARITALLLGELSETEAAALRAEIARDPELASLHERLSRTIGLVAEVAASGDEAAMPQPARAKLSEAKRERLLGSFKVVHTPQLALWHRRIRVSRELTTLAAMILVLAVLGAFVLRKQFTGIRGIFVVASNEGASTSASDTIPDSVWKADEEIPRTVTVTVPQGGQPQPRDLGIELPTSEANVRSSSRSAQEVWSKEKLSEIDRAWKEPGAGVPRKETLRGDRDSDMPAGAVDREWHAPAGNSSFDMTLRGRIVLPEGGADVHLQRGAKPAEAKTLPTDSTPELEANVAGVGVNTAGSVPTRKTDDEVKVEAVDQLARRNVSRGFGGIGGSGGGGAGGPVAGQEDRFALGYFADTGVDPSTTVIRTNGSSGGVFADGGAAAQAAENSPQAPAGPAVGKDNRLGARFFAGNAGGRTNAYLESQSGQANLRSSQLDGTSPGFGLADINGRTDAQQPSTFGSSVSGVQNSWEGRFKVPQIGEVAKPAPTSLPIDEFAQESLAGDKLAIAVPQLRARVENEGRVGTPGQVGKPAASMPSTVAAPVLPPSLDASTGLPLSMTTKKEDLSADAVLGRDLSSTSTRDATLGEKLDRNQDALSDAIAAIDPATGLPFEGGLIAPTVKSPTPERMMKLGVAPQSEYEKLKSLQYSRTNFSEADLKKARATSSPDPVLTQLSEEVERLERRLAEQPQNATEKRGGQNVERELAQKKQQLAKRLENFKDGLQRTPGIDATPEALDKTVEEAKRTVAPAAPTPQPEVYTTDNPFSTFSLNVSDVSFKLAEASLQKGVLPEAASIRSEEFINAFDYRDPEAAPGKPVAFAWDRARYPFAHSRDLLRFSIKTAAIGRQAGRPANLVLLLDNSGSMERADRVRIIKECLRALATQLNPQDRVSVVSFARTPRLWVDGMAGTQAAELADRVGSLTPEGGTNLEEGMNLAYETARRHFVAQGINRVVVLTDGAANLGDIEPASLKQKVEANRKQGIALDCFGIGWEGYNDDLLEQLSRNGDGRYGFINTPEGAATEFASQLVGALQVAASDVKVQVEFNPRRVTSYRQVGYAKHQLQKEQFRDNTVDAAEIAAAEAGNALYVVQVNPRGEGPLGVVRVRYKTPGTTEYFEHEWPVPFSGSIPSMEEAAPPMRLAGVASAFSEWLATSPFAAEIRPDQLLRYMNGVPEAFGGDPRPRQLESMIRQSIALAGSR